MLTSLPLSRIPRYSAATGHEPVLGPDRGTEVDARARAAVLRAAPTNRELTVRADRRERAEKLRQARHGRAEDDVQVAVHGQTITKRFLVMIVTQVRYHSAVIVQCVVLTAALSCGSPCAACLHPCARL